MKIKYQQGSNATIVCENRSIFAAVLGLPFFAMGVFIMMPEGGTPSDALWFGALFALVGLFLLVIGFETTRIVIDTAGRTLTLQRERWWYRYKTESYPLDGMCIRLGYSHGRNGRNYRIEFANDTKVIPVTTSYDNINVNGKYKDAQTIADACNIPFEG